jgi:predicted transcriptional regulator
MKKHNGMRPHDVVILLKIASKGSDEWLMKDLAYEVKISASEVSESFNRSVYAGLLSADKKRLMRTALLEFLEHGLKYVYPQQPGPLVRGMATAFSAEPLLNDIQANEQVVWPYAEGNIRGQAIEPLHPNVPSACMEDKNLYELLALIDALRIGRKREKQIAMEELKKRL